MEQTATIRAPSGSTVNLRKHQDKGSALVDRMPIGATVTVEYQGDEWSQVRYKGKTGYVMTEFLKLDDASGSGSEPENDSDIGTESGEKPDQVTISLSRAQAELLRPVLNALVNQL